MIKGLKEIEKRSREAAAISGGGDWIRQLKIKDGDIALVRFITDSEDLIKAKFHDVKKVTPKGEFTFPNYCTKEDTGICQRCSEGLVTYNTLNLWAYVYYILHKTQNPRIQAGSTEGIWQQVKSGKVILYKEEVDNFMWFRTKVGFQGRYQELFIKYSDKFGTLIDRDYTWSRRGSSATNTNYDLDDKKETALDAAIIERAKLLPDLGDVVSGRVQTFGQKVEDVQVESTEDKKSEDDSDLF